MIPSPRTRPRRLGPLALAFALVLAACGDDGGNAAAEGQAAADDLRPVTLMLNWTPNAHHAGIYVAATHGLYEDRGLDVTIVEPSGPGALQSVGTGRVHFGVSVAESLLPARAAGIPAVSIATVLPDNDSSLMALASSGIERPADLAGRTYGGFGGALETELISRLVACDGGDPDAVEHVEVGDVDYLAGLERGRFDFVWVFEGWDALRARELEGAELATIPFIDHQDCIPNWYTPLLVTGEALLADDPGLVAAFLAATAEGYDVAVEDPDAAADALLAGAPESDEALVRAATAYHAPRFTRPGQPWGVQDPAVWERFAAFILDAGLVEGDLDVAAAFTNDALPDPAP